jgi:hypothetical protein
MKRYIKSTAYKYRPLFDGSMTDEYDVDDVVLNLEKMYKSCVSSSGRAYLSPDTTIEIIDGQYAVVQNGNVILFDGEPTHITKRLIVGSGLPVYRAITDDGESFELTNSHYRAGTRKAW